MLRHSIYKKFGKKSFQPGGQNMDANPMATVLPGNAQLNTDPNDPRKLNLGPEAQARENASWAVTAEPNIQRPKSVFDNDMFKVPGYNMPTEEQKVSKQDELTKQQETVPSQPGMFDQLKNDFKNNWSDYATLGLTGVSGALNYQDNLRKEQELQRNIQKRGVDAKPLHDYNWMYGRTTSGGTEYQPTIMAQYGANLTPRYAQGGMSAANVEIEGGEFLILPDGTTEIAKGPSHKNGGIDTVLPEGTKVFSNHLRPMDLHKMKPNQKLGLVNKYMEEGGDMSSGFGVDYLKDLDNLQKLISAGKKESKTSSNSDEDNDKNYSSRYKDRTRTFAELAKRYDLRQFQEILDNPFASAVDKQTADLLIRRNSQILEQLFRDQQILNGNSTGEPMPEQPQMSKGGIANPGFEALPGYVQAKIVSNMGNGGNSSKKVSAPTPEPGTSTLPPELRQYVKWDPTFKRKNGSRGVYRLEVPEGLDLDTLSGVAKAAESYGIKNLVQSSNLNMQGKSKIKGFHSGLRPQDFEKKIVAESIGKEEAGKLSELDTRKKAFELMGVKTEGFDLNDADKLYNDDNFREKTFYPAFKQYLPEGEFRSQAGDDSNFGFEHLDAVGKRTPPQTPNPNPNPNTTPTPTPTGIPPGQPESSYTVTETAKGKYERQPYPVSQSIPGAYGLAQAQETFTPAIPEVAAPYVRPQTLNIQSQLQDADNNAIAAMRYGADPNMAYIAGLDSKQKAFQTKQNYDAEGRWKADLYNADAKFKADVYNADAFNTGYNDMYATALSNQSEAKQAAINNLVTSRNKYNQDENLKEFYLNTYGPSLNKKQDQNRLDIAPGATNYSWSSTKTTSGSPATSTPTSTPTPGTTPVTTGATGTTNPATTSPNTTSPAANAPATPAAKTAVKGNGYQLPANAPEMTANETEPTFNLQAQKTNLNPNLPLSMQYGRSPAFSRTTPPAANTQTPTNSPVNPNEITTEDMLKMRFGGEFETYLNPFKKKKKVRGFNKK